MALLLVVLQLAGAVDSKFSKSRTQAPLEPSSRCLLLHLHVPKTGGTSVLSYLANTRPFRKSVCYDRYQPHCCGSSGLKNFSIGFTCGQCMLASGEWAYRSHGVQRLSNVSRIVTFVRSPLMHVRSQIEHSMRRGHYSSVEQKLSSIRNNQPIGGYTLVNLQSLYLLPSRVPPAHKLSKFLSETYFFVGVMDWFWHSMCALEYKLGLFEPKKCSCANETGEAGEEETTPSMSVVVNQHASNISYSASELQQLHELNRADTLLFAEAVALLVSLLRQIEIEHRVNLLSCFW